MKNKHMKRSYIITFVLLMSMIFSIYDYQVSAAGYVNVQKVYNMRSDFIKGVDVSSFYSEIESGVVFKDYNGNTLDEQGFFDFLKTCGINYIRLRIWNQPYNSRNYKGYGGGNCDVYRAEYIGKLATNAGLRVFVDFHYSDFWCDPSKQQAPKEWKNYNLHEKQTAIWNFTNQTLSRLKEANVDVGMVQIGNESNGGLCGETNFYNMCTLFTSASNGVRSVYSTAKVAIHFTNPEKNGLYEYYASELAKNRVNYDVFASSYYPYWHGTTSNLTNVLRNIANKYNKEVLVAETAYPYTTKDGDGHGNSVSSANNYSISEQGQATAVRDVCQAVANVGYKGLGVFYWEPAWIPVEYAYDRNGRLNNSIYNSNKEKWEKYGSGWASSYSSEYDPKDAGRYYGGSSWDNQAMFDFWGNPLGSLRVFSLMN